MGNIGEEEEAMTEVIQGERDDFVFRRKTGACLRQHSTRNTYTERYSAATNIMSASCGCWQRNDAPLLSPLNVECDATFPENSFFSLHHMYLLWLLLVPYERVRAVCMYNVAHNQVANHAREGERERDHHLQSSHVEVLSLYMA